MPSKKPMARPGASKARAQAQKQEAESAALSALALASSWAAKSREGRGGRLPEEVELWAKSARQNAAQSARLLDALAACGGPAAAALLDGAPSAWLWAPRPTLAQTRGRVAKNASLAHALSRTGQIDWENRSAWVAAIALSMEKSLDGSSVVLDEAAGSAFRGFAECARHLEPWTAAEALRLGQALTRCVADPQMKIGSEHAWSGLSHMRWREADAGGVWEAVAADPQLGAAVAESTLCAPLWSVIFGAPWQTANPEPQPLPRALRFLAEKLTPPMLARAWALCGFDETFKSEAEAAGAPWPAGSEWLQEEAPKAFAQATLPWARAVDFARRPGFLSADRWLQVADKLAFAKKGRHSPYAYAELALSAARREGAEPERWMRSAKKPWRQAIAVVADEMGRDGSFDFPPERALRALAGLWGEAPESWRAEPAAKAARSHFYGESLALAEAAEIGWAAMSAKEKAQREQWAGALEQEEGEAREPSPPARAKGPRRM